MATLGNTNNPTSGWAWPGSGYAFATSFTTPSGPGTLISAIHAYFATPSGASTGYVCVWDNSGTLLGSVNIGALPSGSQSAGGQSWQVGTLSSPLYVAPSTPIWIGGYGTGNVVFSSESGGSSQTKSMGGGGPGSFSGHGNSGIGGAGAYVDYTPSGGRVRRSGVWVNGASEVERSSVATIGQAFVRRSGVWVPGS